MSRRTALLQNWAQPGTASAMDAFFQIHFREIKASFVPDHRNGVMGTACGAGGTAGAAAPLCQLRGKALRRKRCFRRIGPVFQRCLQIIQRILPGGSQSRFGSFPVNGVQQLRRIPLTDDPVARPNRLRMLTVRDRSGADSSAGETVVKKGRWNWTENTVPWKELVTT